MKNLSFILASLFVVTVSNADEMWVCEAQCNPVSIMNTGNTQGASVKMTLPNQKVEGKIKGVNTANTGEKKIDVKVPATNGGGCSTENRCKAVGATGKEAATKLLNIFKAEANNISNPSANVCNGRSFSNWICSTTDANGIVTTKGKGDFLTADDNYGGPTDAKPAKQ